MADKTTSQTPTPAPADGIPYSPPGVTWRTGPEPSY